MLFSPYNFGIKSIFAKLVSLSNWLKQVNLIMLGCVSDILVLPDTSVILAFREQTDKRTQVTNFGLAILVRFLIARSVLELN